MTRPIDIEITQPLDTMLHQILNQALVAIDAKAGSLMLVAEISIASWVVRHQQSYLCPDVNNDSNFLPSRSGDYFVSLLSVPIVHEGKVIAVINADSEERRFFSAKHRSLLESVARQVSKPIAERISIIDALAEVGVELTSTIQGWGEVSY